jgi:3alpha(or 20beta)-hydroxysteroid dehydrogenase
MSAALANKVLILTGAAGGQGRIAARVFVEAGARLVLTDRDEAGAEVARENGPDAIFLRHNVGSREEWDVVVAETVGRFGRVDVLINNAAIAGRDDIASLTPERMRNYLDVNLIGALNGIQAVVPVMRAGGGGSIVNICSISALRSTPGLAGYGISKWALRGLSRYAATDLASDRIRVNLILPGAVEVSMIKDGWAAAGKASVAAQVPMRRVAHVEEIANAALFLASDAASYITGAELAVDGGLTA